MSRFGENLKHLRQKANMTQKALADMLGISKSAVSGYEQNTRFPSASMLLKIANVFNVSADYLCGREEQRTLDISDLVNEDIEFLRATVRFIRKKNRDERNTDYEEGKI